ncbi:hypothetical protein PUR34_41285 [Streptomyces sp. JV185]|uniref:hypothetical protein n=1 Tax=Streptomyces sp. JV185 TaxID=858638 RepID=UPI002E76962E|nr:hypothetical protein [Streptomyces sp. JV185]MEE1774438.1 hypothetical protein [Streptomyces sp. JV185]
MALPGQRAAQRPMRAAVSAQRAIGRSVTTSGGTTGRLVMWVDGRWVEQVIDDKGQEQLVPFEFEEGGNGW